jgi:hypothetical protein
MFKDVKLNTLHIMQWDGWGRFPFDGTKLLNEMERKMHRGHSEV